MGARLRHFPERLQMRKQRTLVVGDTARVDAPVYCLAVPRRGAAPRVFAGDRRDIAVPVEHDALARVHRRAMRDDRRLVRVLAAFNAALKPGLVQPRANELNRADVFVRQPLNRADGDELVERIPINWGGFHC